MSNQKAEKGTMKFTVEEKLAIIKEASEKGVKVTLDKYGLYPATFYYWKNNLLGHQKDGLNHKTLKDCQKQIKKLEKMVKTLKLLIAEKELESKLKDEMLKKKYPELRKKS